MCSLGSPSTMKSSLPFILSSVALLPLCCHTIVISAFHPSKWWTASAAENPPCSHNSSHYNHYYQNDNKRNKINDALFNVPRSGSCTTKNTDSKSTSYSSSCPIDLYKYPIFQTLLPSDVERILTSLERIEMDQGNVLISQHDDESNDMYFVQEGELECYMEDKPNKVLKRLEAGDYVGELALFLGTPRALSIRTKESTVLWKLSKEQFDAAVQDTDIYDELILSLLKRAYKDEDVWVTLPKITFRDGTTHTSWDRPHLHTGKFLPFNPTTHILPQLSEDARQTLQNGKMHQEFVTVSGTSDDDTPSTTRRVVVVQDIHASPHTVMQHILDYDQYSKKVPQTLESEMIRKQTNVEAPDTETFFARLKTGMRGFSMEFFFKATHYSQHNTIVWRLDYERLSEIDEACGYWRADPHPDHPTTKTRLYYSVDMSLGPRVATCVANFINKKGAADAMGWVKKYSEMDAKQK